MFERSIPGKQLGRLRTRVADDPGFSMAVLALGRVPRRWLGGCVQALSCLSRCQLLQATHRTLHGGRRARLLPPGTRAAASAERGLCAAARPRPRDLELAPPRAARARAERPRGARPRAPRPRTGAATVSSTSGNCGASRLACARTWVQTRSVKTARTPVQASAYAQITGPLRASWWVHVRVRHAYLLLKKFLEILNYQDVESALCELICRGSEKQSLTSRSNRTF